MPPFSRACTLRLALCAALIACVPNTRAIIFFASGDLNYNTTPPTGELADSGWQWQANWQGYCATPIAPNWFLTSKHLPVPLGKEIEFRGRKYQTTAVFRDDQSDLALWRVCGEFPAFAPLFATNDEAGQTCVFFGYGLTRGPAVTVTNGAVTQLAGWQWNGGNGRLRWGANRIEGSENYGDVPDTLLKGTFDADGGPNEATLAGGDSGGGLYIQGHAGWALAGIGYAVDGPFRYSKDGTSFQAGLTNRRGIYEPSNGDWEQIPLDGPPLPSAFYVSRVSVRKEWIEQTMAANPAPETVPAVVLATDPDGPYEPTPAVVDGESKTLRVPLPDGPAFYQLVGCHAWRITSIRVEGGTVVLSYD
jgi:hypothetical protein